MKKTLVCLTIVGLALAGYSLWVSLQVEERLRAGIAALEARPQVRVLGSHVERGWLSTESEVHFELRGVAGALFQAPLEWAGRETVRSRVGFRLEQHIDHGPSSLWHWLSTGAAGAPLLAHAEATLALDQESHAELAAAFGRLPAMRALVSVRSTGDADGRLSMGPVPLRPRDVEAGEAPRWTGRFRGLDGTLAVRAGELRIDLASDGIELNGPELHFAALGWTATSLGGWLNTSAGETTHTLRNGRLAVGPGADHVVWEVAEATPAPAASSDAQAEPVAKPDAAAQGPTPEALWGVEGLAWNSTNGDERLEVAAQLDRGRWNQTALEGVELEVAWPRVPVTPPGERPEHWTEALGMAPAFTVGLLQGQVDEGPFAVSGELRFEGESESPGHLDELTADVPGARARGLVAAHARRRRRAPGGLARGRRLRTWTPGAGHASRVGRSGHPRERARGGRPRAGGAPCCPTPKTRPRWPPPRTRPGKATQTRTRRA